MRHRHTGAQSVRQNCTTHKLTDRLKRCEQLGVVGYKNATFSATPFTRYERMRRRLCRTATAANMLLWLSLADGRCTRTARKRSKSTRTQQQKRAPWLRRTRFELTGIENACPAHAYAECNYSLRRRTHPRGHFPHPHHNIELVCVCMQYTLSVHCKLEGAGVGVGLEKGHECNRSDARVHDDVDKLLSAVCRTTRALCWRLLRARTFARELNMCVCLWVCAGDWQIMSTVRLSSV